MNGSTTESMRSLMVAVVLKFGGCGSGRLRGGGRRRGLLGRRTRHGDQQRLRPSRTVPRMWAGLMQSLSQILATLQFCN